MADSVAILGIYGIVRPHFEGQHYPVYTKDGHAVGHLAGTLTDTSMQGLSMDLSSWKGDRQMIAVPRTEMRQDGRSPTNLV